jgi:tRNA pseudouridine55 synthase
VTTRMSHGLLVLDKPHGLTSRAALDQALRWFPHGTKVGHTGTLDPLATGVLVLCVGRATRLTEFVQDMPKAYDADITLGDRSATDDAEGPITSVAVESPPDRAAVETAIASFVGTILQVPPAYSAAKLAGRRSYDLARQGRPVDLAPRTVRIDRIEALAYEYPALRLRIDCGKGTYIRSLARDLGERLGCGGYVSALRRTRVGPFVSEQAVPLDADAATAQARLLPPAMAASKLPSVVCDEIQLSRFASGQAVPFGTQSGVEIGPDTTLAVFDAAGQFGGIGRTDSDARLVRPVKVFIG